MVAFSILCPLELNVFKLKAVLTEVRTVTSTIASIAFGTYVSIYPNESIPLFSVFLFDIFHDEKIIYSLFWVLAHTRPIK